MDRMSPSARSRQMSLVKSKDTGPELTIRRLVYSMGYRYRVHVSQLPGKPDLVFTRKKKAIFVHGCFWHRHQGCKKATTPATRQDYWLPKFARTVERDKIALKELRALGWRTLVIWECELADKTKLERRLRTFLEN